MARPLRVDVAGGWYHTTARGHNRGAIFLDREDRQHFLERLAELPARFRVEVHAYVLMDNHYHLLLRTPEANVSRTMQWLNVSYGVWWNRRHGRCGNVFQGRFKSVLVEAGGWIVEISLYLHLNPVAVQALGWSKREKAAERRGLKKAPSATVARERLDTLRAYLWSSYPVYAGYAAAPDWLQTSETWRRAGGRERYRKLAEARVRGGWGESLWSQLKWGTVLGGAEFSERIRPGLASGREIAGQRELKRHKTWAEIVHAVEAVKGEAWAAFSQRRGDWGLALALWASRRWGGLTLREAGTCAGGMDYTAVAMAVRRLEERRLRDAVVQQQMKRLALECEK